MKLLNGGDGPHVQSIAHVVLLAENREHVGLRFFDENMESMTFVLDIDAAEHLAMSLRFHTDYATGTINALPELSQERITEFNEQRREQMKRQLAAEPATA